ncbi:YlcI/YnfO family protein [Accumulibacter sp.]|uniref:YlcI/YnfO family protein n=1 Tax=Accumulibacter sp. TaxID=2053492 RepID=UPI0028C3A54E|nr:YlcI/YnfO family protein [Accumulibacter sp.]
MKTATIPSLRVDPKLRQSAESVRYEGESLSGFVEQAIRATIEYRQAQREFIARGLAARDEAQRTGVYIEAAAVVSRLEAMLDRAKSGAKSSR